MPKYAVPYHEPSITFDLLADAPCVGTYGHRLAHAMSLRTLPWEQAELAQAIGATHCVDVMLTQAQRLARRRPPKDTRSIPASYAVTGPGPHS